MEGFFDAPPPAEPGRKPQRHRRPPWIGPPNGTLPGVVPVELIIARTDEVAVGVGRILAYPHEVVFSDEHLPDWPDDDDGAPEIVRIR